MSAFKLLIFVLHMCFWKKSYTSLDYKDQITQELFSITGFKDSNNHM